MLRRRVTRFVIPAAFYTLLVLGWQLSAQANWQPGSVAVPPSVIGQTLIERWNAIMLVSGVTLTQAFSGFVIGVGSALVLAVIMDRFRRVGEGFYRLALVLYTVPVIAIAAPLVAVLGLGPGSKITIAAIAAYFPVLVNLTGALRTLDPRIEELGRVLAIGYLARLARLRAPATLPALFSGLRIAGPAAFIGAIIAEWLGAELGLGVMLLQAMFSFNVPMLWTVLLVATVLNGGIVLLITLAGRFATPWLPQTSAGAA